MSSNTTVHLDPPPLVETKLESGQMTSVARMFGAEGCATFRRLLDELGAENSAITSQLAQHLEGNHQEHGQEMRRLRSVLAWRRSEADPQVYSQTIGAEHLPAEVLARGVSSLEVSLRVGVSTLETCFTQTILSQHEVSAVERQKLGHSLQRVVNRRVNQILAVAVQQQVAQKLRQTLDQRHRLTIQNRVTANCTYRTYATASISSL